MVSDRSSSAGARNTDAERTTVWEFPHREVAHDVVKETDVPIPMRDGLELAANVYRPAAPGEYPVIVGFTPYGKDVYWGDAGKVYGEAWAGTGVGYEEWSPPVAESCAFEAENHRFWVPHGYVVLTVDARGHWKSPGDDGLGNVGRDMYDTIEWAGERAWSNGNVGLSGVSALSRHQYYAAARDPPHLKAICPWEGTPGEFLEHGGVGPQTSPLEAIFETFDPPDNPAWDAPAETDPVEFDPRLPDEWFTAVSQPALVCGTWTNHGVVGRYDFRAFRTIGSEHKWLYTHGREKWGAFYETEAQAFRKLFFDCFLKRTDTRILDVPPVRLEVRDTLHDWSVRREADFPLPETNYRTLYLDASTNGLTEAGPPDTAATASYASEEPDAVVFDHTFDEDTAVVGYQRLKLWVTPEDAPDADLFVSVRKLDADGEEVRFTGYGAPLRYPVALGFDRVSHRTLDEERSTAWEPYFSVDADPEEVRPGETVETDVPILPSGTRYDAGETLRVEVAGRFLGEDDLTVSYPAREAGETPFEWETVNEGEHTVHTGGKYPSQLLIPDVPVTEPFGPS